MTDTSAIPRQCVGDINCDKNAVVGVGNPSRWYCLSHFDEEMKRIGGVIKGFLKHD